MTKRVSGITVEIGGDTTKLGKALGDVNKESRSLQGELRGVETLLKMDPSNVELITQKQKILNESIDETRKKLDILKGAQAQVQEQFDKGEITEQQYRDFQREIINTEKKLESLEKQAKEFGSTASASLIAASEKTKEFGEKMETAGKKFAPFSAAAAGVLTGTTVMAITFEDSMAKLDTIADTRTVSLKDLETQILELSNSTGLSANDLAEAAYNAISAGQDTADAISFVENATRLSRAGFTDTGKSLDILTTIMNAYGLEADEVGKVSDTLIQTQNLGKTTVDELASSMGKIIPTAKANNVELEQLAAGYSIMTANGIATAETTTYMNAMLNELGKGGTGVDLILREKTGKSFAQLSEEGQSLGDVLGILKEDADENGKSFGDLWSSSEAGKAALVLLGDSADGFNDRLVEMQNTTGATDEAFEKLETTSYKGKVALNQVKNSALLLGQTALEALAPVLESIAKSIEKVTAWFNELSPGVKQAIVIVLGLIAALAPVLIVVGKMARGLSDILLVAAKLKPVFLAIGGAISAPVAIVVAAIAAVVAIFVVLWKKSDAFRNFWIELWEGIKNAASAAWEWIKGAWEKALDFFPDLWEKITKGATELWDSVKEVWNNTIEGLKQAWDTMISFFVDLWNGIVDGATAGWEWITSGIMSILEPFITLFETIWNNLSEHLSTIWDSIKTIASNAWELIKNLILGPVLLLIDLVTGDFEGFKEHLSQIWENIKEAVENIWNAIKDAVIAYVSAIVETLSILWDTLKEKVIEIFESVATFLTETWEKIKTSVTEAATALKDGVILAWTTLKETVVEFAIGIRDGAINAWETLKSTVVDLADGLREGAVEAWEKLKTLTSDIFNGVVDSIKTILDIDLFEIGTNIIQGLIDGIKSMVSAVGEAISGVANGIKNGIKGALNINSPSRWMRDMVGKMIPQGIAVGVKADTSKAVAAMDELSDQVMDASQPEMVNMMARNPMVSPSNQIQSVRDSLGGGGTLASKIDTMIGILAQYLPHLEDEKQLVLDTGIVAGAVAPGVNRALGQDSSRRERGI